MNKNTPKTPKKPKTQKQKTQATKQTQTNKIHQTPNPLFKNKTWLHLATSVLYSV